MENLKNKIQFIVDLYRSKDLLKAEISCKELILQKPKEVFLYNLLGLIFVGLGKIKLAINTYEQGIKIDPTFPMLYNNLGLIYLDHKKDYINAEKYFIKSIKIKDKFPEAHNNLGTLYKSLDKFNDAIDCYKKAIEINPNFFQAHHNLGNIYTSMGDFNNAKKNFFKAIEINPEYTNSHRTLSRLVKYTENDKHFTELKDAYKKIKIEDIENKTNISFALGKAYEDIKDFKKSFDLYNEANLLYKKIANFSIKNEIDKFERIKDTFHKKIYNKFNDCGYAEESPIFILGMPRSGSTLIEQILSSHPKVYGGDECEFIHQILNKNFGKTNLRLFFEDVINFDKNELKQMGEEYISKMKKNSGLCKRQTDKMPENFFWIGFIKLILPKSKIIHSCRNAKDVCFSIFKNHFPGGKISYSYDLDEIVTYYNLYSDLMNYWDNLFPDFIYNIKYENLISDTENETRKLLTFCDLQWDDKCLDFQTNKRAIKTASDVQARNKIYSSSINSWMNYHKYFKVYFDKLKN